MDIGDWVFWGLVAVSGIASLSKAVKKKASEQTSQQPTSSDVEKSDADEWLKNILRETSKGFLDADDEFIPKNDPKPTVMRPENQASRPINTYSKSKSETAETYANAERYRRTNQSLEGAARPRVSLENTDVVEGQVSHTGLRSSSHSTVVDTVYDQPQLDPVDDFKHAEEVRKAVIYGEIMRTKF